MIKDGTDVMISPDDWGLTILPLSTCEMYLV